MVKPSFRVVGLMAGSSQDGVDMALVRFWRPGERWQYEVLTAETIPYPHELEVALHRLLELSGEVLLRLGVAYTDWTAAVLRERLRGQVYDLISWHGPTAFHQPAQGLTWGLGDSERLRALVGKPVIMHFRARDIAYGGQGAPLIPHADAHLWPEYETLLNLGGIANITHLPTWAAFDISPCNQLLNALARQFDPSHRYDPDGTFAKQGQIIPSLLETFLTAPIFQVSPSPAITNEIVRTQFLTPFLTHPAPAQDKLHTAVQAIAMKLSETFRRLRCEKVYLTGGGARNTYLVKTIQAHSPCPCFLAPDVLIDFREAIGFAFLGLLGYLGEDNLLSGWTLARRSQRAGLLSL